MLLLSETQLLEKVLYTCQTSFYMLLCFIFRVAFVVMYFMLCYLLLCILCYVFSHRGIFLCVCVVTSKTFCPLLPSSHEGHWVIKHSQGQNLLEGWFGSPVMRNGTFIPTSLHLVSHCITGL